MKHPTIWKRLSVAYAIAVILAACAQIEPTRPTLTPTPTYRPTWTANPALMPASPDAEQRNGDMLAALKQTVQPTPLSQARTNETGLIPGQTTEQQVVNLLGEPAKKGMVSRGRSFWEWGGVLGAASLRVAFSNGVVIQVERTVRDLTAKALVVQYGGPEFVLFHPNPVYYNPNNGTLAPPRPTWHELVYPTRGISFYVGPIYGWFSESIPADTPIYEEHYFVPVTIFEWVEREKPYWEKHWYIGQWTGAGQ